MNEKIITLITVFILSVVWVIIGRRIARKFNLGVSSERESRNLVFITLIIAQIIMTLADIIFRLIGLDKFIILCVKSVLCSVIIGMGFDASRNIKKGIE